MIFVSVGTHPQPFSRLLNEVARLVDEKKIREEVIVQAGTTPFSHPKMKVASFMDIETFEKTLSQSRIFITHAGEGNIGTALQMRKPMIIVPRRFSRGEHTNDHQLELANAIAERGDAQVVESILDWKTIEKEARAHTPTRERGYVTQSVAGFAYERGIVKKPLIVTKEKTPRSATIVVATLNGGEPLIKAINGMLVQDFVGPYEIVVVDDGSFDGKTPGLLAQHFGKNGRVKLIFLPRSGVCKARNAGIRAATGEVVINMDHDCIPEKSWLRTMVSGFTSPRVGAVSAYGHYGGTSTGFRKDLLDHLQGYDEDFFYYREDTDLSFRILELGFDYVKVDGARYREDRTLVTPRGIKGILRYTHQRLRYHMNDVLLHRKHPTPLCRDFLHVKGKWFVDPVEDFKVATGLWENPEKELALSSPRGMTFRANRGFADFVLIVGMGLAYTVAIKMARLAGSIKHGHLLL